MAIAKWRVPQTLEDSDRFLPTPVELVEALPHLDRRDCQRRHRVRREVRATRRAGKRARSRLRELQWLLRELQSLLRELQSLLRELQSLLR